MWQVLHHPVFARLFAAQVLALLGTGLLTVGLGLLAFDLAGGEAARVLATAYTLKMLAYVGLSPVFAALVARLPRRAVLVWADTLRMSVALTLPFITEVWQIYLAIFALQSASACFTPAFQATIPDVLPAEQDYAQALSLSRLAYDLENLASPVIAAALLSLFSFHALFAGTALGFALSAFIILRLRLPRAAPPKDAAFVQRLTKGARIYLATPRLRGLLAVTLTAAAASAFVIVNTVVIVKAGFGRSDGAVALALAAYGAGSMLMALSLPRLLARFGDRPVMLSGAAGLTALMLGQAVLSPGWGLFLIFWTLTGAGYAAALTPQGRLLRRSAHAADRPAVFAAQFALSHGCWLITYPLAGALMTGFGAASTLAVLGGLGLAGLLLALLLWTAEGDRALPHQHDDLDRDHPHLRAHGVPHKHTIIIDDLHPRWPALNEVEGAIPPAPPPAPAPRR